MTAEEENGIHKSYFSPPPHLKLAYYYSALENSEEKIRLTPSLQSGRVITYLNLD